MKTACRWLLAVVAMCAAAGAQERTFTLDPAASTVEFTLSGNFHTVHGTFHFQQGAVTFNVATGAASGTLVVEATSGASGNDARDRRMKREILETEKYPQVTLTFERIEGAIAPAGKSAVTVHGSMMLHGQAHAIDFPAEITIDGENATAIAELVIPYVAWGLKNPSSFIFRVSDKVTMHSSAAGRITPQ